MPPGPVLILALPDDPFVTAFRRVSQVTAGTVDVWQPADLGEIGWSVTLAGGTTVRLIDRTSGRTWESSELGGIWFQAMPPFGAIESLEERDRQYVIAEIRSSLAAVWRHAACPVVGQPTREGIDEALGPGPEARIALRRLHLPCASMLLGPETIRTAASQAEVRIAPLGNTSSRWFNPARPGMDDDLAIAMAIPSDDRRARVIALAGTAMRVFALSEAGAISEEDATAADKAMAARIRTASGLELALAFCVLQDGEWRITRLSAQLPWWLAEAPGGTEWIAEWLAERFATRTVATVSIGSHR